MQKVNLNSLVGRFTFISTDEAQWQLTVSLIFTKLLVQIASLTMNYGHVTAVKLQAENMNNTDAIQRVSWNTENKTTT